MAFYHSKTRDVRITETMALVTAAYPPAAVGMTFLRKLALYEIGHRFSILRTGDQQAISDAMALGTRFDIRGRDAETIRRHWIRAVVLAYGLLGDPTDAHRVIRGAALTAKREAIRGQTQVALRALMDTLLDGAIDVTAGTNALVGMRTTQDGHQCNHAARSLVETFARCQQTLMAAKLPSGAAAKTLFTTWFGAAGVSNANITEVHRRFGLMHRACQTGFIFIRDDDPTNDNVFAYVYPNEPDQARCVYLCGAFWRSTRFTWQANAGTMVRVDNQTRLDNPLGVLVHELSHLVLKTHDHVYGTQGAKALAISNAAQARENADNIEYFSETIMLQGATAQTTVATGRVGVGLPAMNIPLGRPH